MLRALLRAAFWPLARLLALLLVLWVRLRVGRRGVLTLHLDDTLEHPVVVAARVEAIVRRSRARGLFLHLDGVDFGWATTQEWQAMLARLRDDGVLVVVMAPGLDARAAMLSASADRLVMPPAADWAALGVSAELTFFGEALERLGVRAEVEAAGAYKSLGEPFTRRWASPESREATGAVVEGLYAELVAALAAGRRMSPERVRALIDAAPLSAEEAREAGLIDAVCHDDGLDALLEDLLGEGVRPVPLGAAAWPLALARRLEDAVSAAPVLAVVHLSGNVTMGQEPARGRPRIAPPEVAPLLASLREAPRVGAVVLAVDSPGGSALASDLIWREVELLSREKPVVAWFGDVAASGGYYLAAPARTIVARPTTITGSIGVVGFKLAVGEGAARLGVHAEAIERGQNAGMFSAQRPFSPAARAAFRRRLDHTYALFLDRVAAGRRAPVEAVERVARGRVWTGKDAVEQGLADVLGGLDEALAAARGQAGLDARALRWDLVVRPPQPLWMRLLPRGLPGASVVGGLGEAEALAAQAGQPLALLPQRPRLR